MRSPTCTHVASPPTDDRLKACAVSYSQLMPYPAKTRTWGRFIGIPIPRPTSQAEGTRTTKADGTDRKNKAHFSLRVTCQGHSVFGWGLHNRCQEAIKGCVPSE